MENLIEEPTLEDFLTEEQLEEMAIYAEACSRYADSKAQYRNERIQFGDASFGLGEEPQLPEWYEDAWIAFGKAMDNRVSNFDEEVTEEDLPF